MHYLFNKKGWDNYRVEIINSDIDGVETKEYIEVSARDINHAKRRALIIANTSSHNETLEEKSFGLLYKKSARKFWRLRNYERSAQHIFNSGGVRTGSMIRSAISQATENMQQTKITELLSGTELNKRKKVIIASMCCYFTFLFISILLMTHGFFGNTQGFKFLPGVNVFILSGLILCFIAVVSLIHSYKYLTAANRLLNKDTDCYGR